MIEYDPDKKPEIASEIWQIGQENRAFPIQVFCDEPEANVGDATGVSCIALAHFIPHPGEQIWREKKTPCIVDSVRHSLLTVRRDDGSAKSVMLVPVVHATIAEQP